MLKPYDDQREPSCWHDPHQPASMCIVCREDPEVVEWLRLSAARAAERAAGSSPSRRPL